MGQNRAGANGDDIVVKVPPGTQVYAEDNETLMAYLMKAGDRRASFHIRESYDVGTISPYKRFLWFVTRHWLILVPTLFVSVLLFAWVVKKRLANVEYRRLAHTEAPK